MVPKQPFSISGAPVVAKPPAARPAIQGVTQTLAPKNAQAVAQIPPEPLAASTINSRDSAGQSSALIPVGGEEVATLNLADYHRTRRYSSSQSSLSVFPDALAVTISQVVNSAVGAVRDATREQSEAKDKALLAALTEVSESRAMFAQALKDVTAAATASANTARELAAHIMASQQRQEDSSSHRLKEDREVLFKLVDMLKPKGPAGNSPSQ